MRLLWKSSNRTNVGLKPVRGRDESHVFPEFKSHQCGIETEASTAGNGQGLGSNRTNVGLKPVAHTGSVSSARVQIAPMWD